MFLCTRNANVYIADDLLPCFDIGRAFIMQITDLALIFAAFG